MCPTPGAKVAYWPLTWRCAPFAISFKYAMHPFMLATLLVVALVPTWAGAQAQARPPVRLVGFVHDHLRRPLPGAEVLLNRTRVAAVSDSAGIFSLTIAPSDSTIAFRRIGYHPLLLTLHPLPPSDTILVQLYPAPVALPEIITTAPPSKPLRYAGTTKYDDVFLRKRVGLGTLITREMIDQRFGFSTAELMVGLVPGVRYRNSAPRRLVFPRCQDTGGITIYVDGSRQGIAGATQIVQSSGMWLRRGRSDSSVVRDFPEIEILERINPSDIEMIEVFRGAAELPGVFHWDGCAVIAIWTRWNR